MIDSKIIDEIREKSDIVSIVSDYVALRKRGRNYLALCPFHSEKTPSFTVSQEKQLYHCFGCGEGGNAISFMMKIDNLSFQEAVKHLADKAGVACEISGGAPSKERSANQLLYEINLAAGEFFRAQLPKSDTAVEYVKKRGLDKEALASSGIGYSLESWDALYRHLTSKGYLPKDIEKAGLIIPRDGTSSFYDRFRNRLMIPVRDIKGRTVGFGARSLDGSDPKYLNSPDSPVYNKGNILYGLDKAKDAIKENDSVLIVEGYMDQIACFNNGFRNTVASSGTALTVNHAKVLQRSTANFILVFDSDTAGSLATERSIELLGQIGIYPKIAPLSGGKDPDEIIKKEGKEKFAALIGSAVPWMKYKIGKITGRHNIKEAEGKSKALKEAAPVLARETDAVIQKEYIKSLAAALNIDSDTVTAEVKRLGYFRKNPFSGRSEPIKKPSSGTPKAEKAVIRLSAEDWKLRKIASAELSPSDFLDDSNRSIFLIIASAEETLDASRIVDLIEDDGAKARFSEIMLDEGEPENREKAMSDCIGAIKSNRVKVKLEEIRAQIRAAEEKQDLGALEALQSEYKKYHAEIRAI